MNRTGRQETFEGRPALRFERRLAHPQERVWRAISEPDELARWFVAPVSWIPEEGETFESFGEQATVTTVDPPNTLAWDWGEDRFRFELTPHEDGCTLVFIHVYSLERGPAHQHAAGWETYLNRLDVHLGGGHLTEEDAHADFDAHMADYKEAFA